MNKDNIRESKIEVLIDILKDNDIWLVDQSRIGNVKITNPVNEEFLHDILVESDIFTEDDFSKIKGFFDITGIKLISPENFYGISFEDCLLNVENLYDSKLFLEE